MIKLVWRQGAKGAIEAKVKKSNAPIAPDASNNLFWRFNGKNN